MVVYAAQGGVQNMQNSIFTVWSEDLKKNQVSITLCWLIPRNMNVVRYLIIWTKRNKLAWEMMYILGCWDILQIVAQISSLPNNIWQQYFRC